MNSQMQLIIPCNSLKQLLSCLWHDESGQDMVEYALVAVAMGLFTVLGVHGLASSISNDMNIVINAFASATALP